MTKSGWDSIGTAASCHKGGAYLFERILALNAFMGAEHRVEEITSFATRFVGRHLHNPQLALSSTLLTFASRSRAILKASAFPYGARKLAISS
jgi:hypothetical protein